MMMLCCCFGCFVAARAPPNGYNGISSELAMTKPRRKSAKERKPAVFVVGIGVSAAETAPLAELMRGLRRGNALAYVVVPTDGMNGVRETLEASATKTENDARHGLRIEADTIYLAPCEQE